MNFVLTKNAWCPDLATACVWLACPKGACFDLFVWAKIALTLAINMPCSSKKRLKEDLTHRYCLYCKANRDKRGFDKHQAACRVIWQLQCRQQNPAIRQSSSKQKQADDGVNFPNSAEVDPEVDPEVMFNLPMAYVCSLIFNRTDL